MAKAKPADETEGPAAASPEINPATDQEEAYEASEESAEAAEEEEVEEYEEPVTALDTLGTALPSNVAAEKPKKEEKTPAEFTKLAESLGLSEADILSHNAKSRVVVFSNGAKYQLSRKGKSVRHLAGPVAPANTDLSIEDYRARGSSLSSAAALNAPAAVSESSKASLEAELEAARANVKRIKSELKDAEDEE